MAKRGAGLSGAALAFVLTGAYFVYVGVRDVPVVDGLRALLRGETPDGKAVKLDLSAAPTAATAGLGSSVTGAGPPSGKIVTVPGTSIRVDSSIAANVSAMVTGAKLQGITLNGGGYRSHLEQAATRKKNGCTCSDRSDCCSPPTAPVGQSMHEQGLAIDFVNCQTHSTAVYKWLAANASKFGLRNLPSEPWHWSTNGH